MKCLISRATCLASKQLTARQETPNFALQCNTAFRSAFSIPATSFDNLSQLFQFVNVVGFQKRDFLAKMFFDFLHYIHRPLTVNKVHCYAALSKPACPTNPVQVGFEIRFASWLHWHVIIHHDCHLPRRKENETVFPRELKHLLRLQLRLWQ